jgi:hypothetical protein
LFSFSSRWFDSESHTSEEWPVTWTFSNIAIGNTGFVHLIAGMLSFDDRPTGPNLGSFNVRTAPLAVRLLCLTAVDLLVDLTGQSMPR